MCAEKEQVKKITLRPRDVAEVFGIPKSTLAYLRCVGGGPRYFKQPGGRSIFYLLSEVEEWITSDPGKPKLLT
jgi:predicted DNA-binding transcriptional regulator AlpA